MQQAFTIPNTNFPGRKALANRRYRARKKGLPVPLLFRPWTEEECKDLIWAYKANEGSKAPWLKMLAVRFGRHPANVVRKARSLGCVTNRVRVVPFDLKLPKVQKQILRRQMTPEERHVEHSNRAKEQWKIYPHPRGMLGKHHTPEVCARISKAHFGSTRPPFTEEHRMKISKAVVARMKSNPASFSRKLNRGIYGRRADIGNQFFRSRYEANYARFLNYHQIEWTYEKKTFWFLNIKRGVRSYTPDFYLPATNEYHEVKGWMDARSKTKLKRMKKYHPDTKIVVIDGAWFKAANKQRMCHFIPGWECDHKRH